MMTDTGAFTYNSNNREIYLIIGELLSKGIDKDEIYRKVFNNCLESRLRLQGFVLYEKMQVFPQFHTALITLTKEEQNRFHCVKGDTEGLVNMPLSIKDICFSVFLREDTEKDMIKVSLRSVGTFPCNKVAADFFNGGGHLNASGGEYYGTLDEAIDLFKQALIRYEDLLLGKK
jgi:phosphoesterase RecJ-like protein